MGSFSVSAINSGNQICRESITQDTINFPASMMWLNFSGNLNVKNPPGIYNTTNALEHDRITITNFGDSVKWFLLKDSVPQITCEFQAPQWSTHPSYAIALGAHGDCGNAPIYGSLAIRFADKKYLWINNFTLTVNANPHLWVAASAIHSADSIQTPIYDDSGFVDQGSIQNFFGTDSVHFVWSSPTNGLSLSYIDFSSSTPQIVHMSKPSNRIGWNADRSHFSPNGHWILYQMYTSVDYYETYVQEMVPNSVPILIDTNAAAPRWWVNPHDPSQLYITYVKFRGQHDYIVKENLSDPTVAIDTSVGMTVIQQIQLAPGLPSTLSMTKIGSLKTLIPLPFKGGLSPDGHFLATGTNGAWMADLQ